MSEVSGDSFLLLCVWRTCVPPKIPFPVSSHTQFIHFTSHTHLNLEKISSSSCFNLFTTHSDPQNKAKNTNILAPLLIIFVFSWSQNDFVRDMTVERLSPFSLVLNAINSKEREEKRDTSCMIIMKFSVEIPDMSAAAAGKQQNKWKRKGKEREVCQSGLRECFTMSYVRRGFSSKAKQIFLSDGEWKGRKIRVQCWSRDHGTEHIREKGLQRGRVMGTFAFNSSRLREKGRRG